VHDESLPGDPIAASAGVLSVTLYNQLRSMAEQRLRREHAGQTLQPTELVHEAFLRLPDAEAMAYENRDHYLRLAAVVMRRVLVDRARARLADKRDGGIRVTLVDDVAGTSDRSVNLLALDDALTRLAAAEPRCAQVVELRFFGGLDIPGTARALDISPATVKRDWLFARAWLARELATDTDAGA
jgi:RNA polymerase sigma factor (TIGR02999 family)